jgi:hypothetical protein
VRDGEGEGHFKCMSFGAWLLGHVAFMRVMAGVKPKVQLLIPRGGGMHRTLDAAVLQP